MVVNAGRGQEVGVDLCADVLLPAVRPIEWFGHAFRVSAGQGSTRLTLDLAANDCAVFEW